MEAKFKFDDFYKKLTENEQQICDLCRDWNFESCEECEFIFRNVSKNEQEVVNGTEEYNKNTKKEW